MPQISFKHQNMLAHKAVTDGDGEFVDVPIAVLIDNRSASASEILAGVMQDLRCPRAGFMSMGRQPPCYVVIGNSTAEAGASVSPPAEGRSSRHHLLSLRRCSR